MTTPTVTVPVEPTEEMLRSGYDAFHNAAAFSFAGRIPSIWSAMLYAAPEVKGPGGYLVKDFADGWYWTPNASGDHASGASVWSVAEGRYETDSPVPAPREYSPEEVGREEAIEAFERTVGCLRNRSVNMAKDIGLVRAYLRARGEQSPNHSDQKEVGNG